MSATGLVKPIVTALVLTPLLLLTLSVASAQVMSSNNYAISADSLNSGGGYSSSTNYQSESTVGEIATGRSASAAYELRAGYQQMLEVYIALTGASAVSMSPNIPGVTGGTANGSTTVMVTTDSLSGYTLSIKAEASPAMRNGAFTIADYTPSGANPDFAFSTLAADAHLGYSPKGVNVVQRFRDQAGACNSGSGLTAGACWDGLSTSDEVIATSAGSNHPAGATTTINFRVGVGSAVVQPAGTYMATTTITALAL